MAEIVLGYTELLTSSQLDGKVTKIIRTVQQISSTSSLSGKVVSIFPVSETIAISQSNVIASGRLIKYPKGQIKAMSKLISKVLQYKTVKAELHAQAKLEAYTYDRDIQTAVQRYLPQYYEEFKDVSEIIRTEANEITRIRALLKELLDQFYVNTATYALERYENIVRIERIPQRSTSSRRHYINSKLRGAGTTTKSNLKEIVDAFYESEIIENNKANQIYIRDTTIDGIPKNFEDVEDTVLGVIPAHLEPHFVFEFQKNRESYLGITAAQNINVQLNPFFMPETQDSTENIYVGSAVTQVNIVTVYAEVD